MSTLINADKSYRIISKGIENGVQKILKRGPPKHAEMPILG